MFFHKRGQTCYLELVKYTVKQKTVDETTKLNSVVYCHLVQ